MSETRKRRAAASRQRLQNATIFNDRPEWEIINADVLDGLQKIRDRGQEVRCWYTDPPYNIGIDYGEGKTADLLDPADYMLWVEQWMDLAKSCLSPDGSMWVMISHEFAGEYAVSLKRLGFTIRNWITWHEPFGTYCHKKFGRCTRLIFYCVKNASDFVFNREAVLVQSDRQRYYKMKNAAPDGKIMSDLWTVPRILAHSKQRLPDFPTQLPFDVVRPAIACSTNEGDLVGDCFSGTATTGVVALSEGRQYIGIEKNKAFHEMSCQRLNVT